MVECAGGSADNDQVRLEGLGNPQERLGRIATGMDERELQAVFGRVPVDLALQLDCLTNGAPVDVLAIAEAAERPGKPGAGIDRGADEYGNGAPA